MERLLKFGLANSTLQARLSYGRTQRSRQKHIETHNEKGSRDQDFEIENRKAISEVGHPNVRKKGSGEEYQWFNDTTPSRSQWFDDQTYEIQAYPERTCED